MLMTDTLTNTLTDTQTNRPIKAA